MYQGAWAMGIVEKLDTRGDIPHGGNLHHLEMSCLFSFSYLSRLLSLEELGMSFCMSIHNPKARFVDSLSTSFVDIEGSGFKLSW